MVDKDDCSKIFTGCFCIVFIVGVILFSLSFSVIELNHVGLFKNTYDVGIENGLVYRPGRLL